MKCQHMGKISQGVIQYFQLIAAGEPFRLMFPLGSIIGIFGVLMWPLYIWNITTIYPGPIHPRIMIEGFLTCFIIGFLGTALPRLHDVPRMTIAETIGFAFALISTTLLHNSGMSYWGDWLFFFTLVMLVGGLLVRSIFRQDTPPPAFVLVAMGILSALIGSFTQAITYISPSALSEFAAPMSRLMLYQGYILLPIMGVGAFLLPRFFGLPNRQSFPESLKLPPGWIKRALFAFTCGAVVMISFTCEVAGLLRLAYGLRAAAVIIYFLREIPIHRAEFGGGSLVLGLRIALLAIPIGYILMAIWPERAVTLLHVVFITGFSLITFTVATRVVFGHSGQSHLFRASIWSVLVMTSLVTLAMLTRVTADWLPTIQMNHYAYAAITWILGIVIWSCFILRHVCSPDLEK